MLVLERILSVGTCLVQGFTPFSQLRFRRGGNLHHKGISPSGLGSLLWHAPRRPIRSRLIFPFFGLDPCSNLFCVFVLQNELLPNVTLCHSHLNEESNLQIMVTCLNQYGLGHAIGTVECHALKSFDKSLDRLSFLLLGCKESWHQNFCIVFEEKSQK